MAKYTKPEKGTSRAGDFSKRVTIPENPDRGKTFPMRPKKVKFISQYESLTVIVPRGKLIVACHFKNGEYLTSDLQNIEHLRKHPSYGDTFQEVTVSPKVSRPLLYDIEVWNGNIMLDMAHHGTIIGALKLIEEHLTHSKMEIRVRLLREPHPNEPE